VPPQVKLTDQVFPSLDVEREILSGIGATLEVLPDTSPEAIREHASQADAVLTTYAPIDRETIGALERCRIISRYGIGVDNIDLDAARERGITVTNVPDYCVEEVADHVLGLLLAAARKLVLANSLVRSGGWGIRELVPVRRLRGRKLGLIGFGHVASAVARRAASFGLEVSAYDPYVPAERMRDEGVSAAGKLDELLSGSDFVSVHVPLLDSTRDLLDEAAIAQMKPEAVLINTSRGPIVSTPAVVAALREGRLAAACLDVFASEPPDAAEFADLPNLIATPHSAFYSEGAILESQTRAAQAIVDVLGGREPRNRVV
jgi:D-3-phosphoglycerate dehydrogenase / 2-oxoglutarate reductase